ncbi:MAG: hypothetical protein K0R18_464 [Bacillales bacterium]|nr:hypothetical protein [Bacillales bacterium]
MPDCNNYTPEEEIKKVWLDDKTIITICESCDDGSLKSVKGQGDTRESFKKIEKIRRGKNQYRHDD